MLEEVINVLLSPVACLGRRNTVIGLTVTDLCFLLPLLCKFNAIFSADSRENYAY